VLAKFRNPVCITTKNALIIRDLDVLQELAQFNAVSVAISITTLDHHITNVLEPRTARPHKRLRTIQKLRDAGIPVGVLIAPIIPGLTDSEIPNILKKIAEAGAEWTQILTIRLPFALGELFEHWLETHFPLKKEKILHRIRLIHGGKLDDARFQYRMTGSGVYAENILQLFEISRNKYNLSTKGPELSSKHFRKQYEQIQLFESKQ